MAFLFVSFIKPCQLKCNFPKNSGKYKLGAHDMKVLNFSHLQELFNEFSNVGDFKPHLLRQEFNFGVLFIILLQLKTLNWRKTSETKGIFACEI